MIDRPVVDFPQPDSPTRPTHSPAPTVNDTPSTAPTVPDRRWNSVRRFSTSRTRSRLGLAAFTVGQRSKTTESPILAHRACGAHPALRRWRGSDDGGSD